MGNVLELALMCLAFRDVAVGADHAQGLAISIAADHHAAAQGPFPATVLAQHTELHTGCAGLTLDVGLERGKHAGRIVGVDAFAPFVRAGAKVGVGIAIHLLVARRVKRLAGLRIPVPKPIARAIDSKFPALFAPQERIFGLLSVGDVLHQSGHKHHPAAGIALRVALDNAGTLLPVR